MKTTMSRGNLQEEVGSVQDRKMDQEEVAEAEEVEEEEMKMENVEGTDNIGTESPENVSSGSFGGEISEVSPTQKRTCACLNSAQDIAQDSGNKASTQPNIAQAVSKGAENDSKQAQTQQLTARGLSKTISKRASNIYNNVYKATYIPRLNIISTDTDDSTTKNEENSISGSLSVNSIDSAIKIYEAGGVDIITLGESNNKLVNNSTVCNNINDKNNNTSVLNEENTPGEVNSENNNLKLLESVDSYPLNLQTETSENEACRTANATPMLRLRGGVGDEFNEGQNE
jgi:hypothetical protein